MHDICLFILTFICGAAYECGCAFWVYFSEKNRIVPAVICSCINALIAVIGLGRALSNPLFIIAYVMGFGTGTGLAITIKKKYLK